MPVSEQFWKTLNQGWPEGMRIPTDKEAIHGVKRMVRHVRGRPLEVKVVVNPSRYRRTWTHQGVMVVAPNYHHPRPGWPAIVHDLSHWLHRRMNRGATPHDSRQARIERQLQKYVIEKLL